MLISGARRLWQWRGFIAETIRRDFAARNAGTAGVWNFVQPLAQIAVYILIFSHVMQARLPGSADTFAYGIFICAGLLPWQLFADTVNRSTQMFVEYGVQIKKAAFPRSALLLTVTGSAFVNFVIVWCFFMLATASVGRFPGVTLLAVVPLLVLLLAMAAALGLLLAVLNVYLRDVGALIATVMPFLFWLTPIVWPLQIVPAAWHPVLQANPLTGVVTALQSAVLHQQWPHWGMLWPAVAFTVVTGVLAVVYYRKWSPGLADEL
ncbi:MAG: ABC transporter permease [Pseudomonadota bacterium]